MRCLRGLVTSREQAYGAIVPWRNHRPPKSVATVQVAPNRVLPLSLQATGRQGQKSGGDRWQMAEKIDFPVFSEKMEREFIACCAIVALSCGADREGMISALVRAATILEHSADPLGDLAAIGGLPAKAKEIMEARERPQC